MLYGVLTFQVRKNEDRWITFLVRFNYRKHAERNLFPTFSAIFPLSVLGLHGATNGGWPKASFS